MARVYSEIGHDENTDPRRERDLHEAWAAVYRALGPDAVPPRLASATIPWWPVFPPADQWTPSGWPARRPPSRSD